MSDDLPERKRPPSRRRAERQLDSYRPGPFALIYTALLAAGTLAAAVVYLVLIHGVPGMATNRADTLKTALLVIGGSGALAGLYVAYRKQRTDEANHLRDQDKLFTERYTQAVTQLGNTNSAAVRLGGVYALARIADDSERDRPTCLKVLCAYLRMPYHPDTAEPAEREVRTTCQAVVAERLIPNHPGYLPGADIDLRGAHLIDLDFSSTVIERLRAEGAIFTGNARFSRAAFTRDPIFKKATFTGDTVFSGATFIGDAWFSEATFTGNTWFTGTTFSEGASFSAATFTGNTWFTRAIFTGNARFGRAAFTGNAEFMGATFAKEVRFDATTFAQGAWFSEVTFSGDTMFSGATFNKAPLWPDGFAEPPGIAI